MINDYAIGQVWGIAVTKKEALFITSERNWRKAKERKEEGERFSLHDGGRATIDPNKDSLWLTEGEPIDRVDAWDYLFEEMAM